MPQTGRSTQTMSNTVTLRKDVPQTHDKGLGIQRTHISVGNETLVNVHRREGDSAPRAAMAMDEKKTAPRQLHTSAD